MKNLSQLHYCFGIEVWRDEDATMVIESKYAGEFVKKCNMNNCKHLFTPLEKMQS